MDKVFSLTHELIAVYGDEIETTLFFHLTVTQFEWDVTLTPIGSDKRKVSTITDRYTLKSIRHSTTEILEVKRVNHNTLKLHYYVYSVVRLLDKYHR